MGRPIDYERFVTVWLESSSIKEVAEKLGVTTVSVGSTANRLRKKGVRLPAYKPQGRYRANVAELNRLIDEYRPRRQSRHK